MSNTLSTLRWMGIALLGFAGLCIWAWLTLYLTKVAWWGLALYVLPVFLGPIAVAIRADLRGRK